MKHNKFNNLVFYNLNRFAQLRIITINLFPPPNPKAENLQKIRNSKSSVPNNKPNDKYHCTSLTMAV